jgi:C_GCAxxG_C_C family probable redox protein
MDPVSRAVDLFKEGYSCTQAVLAAFGPAYGLSEEHALKLGRALGMGLVTGKTCGAVSGALLVLGLAGTPVDGNDKTARYRAYNQARDLMARFEAEQGATQCEALLGVNASTEAGLAEAREKNLFTTLCPRFVDTAARILKEMAGE